jgi:hypothetical protein
MAIWGGLLAGLGLGSCLAWSLNIFEIAHPRLGGTCNNASGCDESLASLYPSMALTVFVVLVFSGAFGVGLGLVASALIRNEAVQNSAAAGSSPTAPKPERRILGLRVDR